MASNLKVDEFGSSIPAPNNKISSDTGVIFDLTSDDSYVKIPKGTTAQRGTPAANGAIRWNSDLGVLEIYRDGLWRISRRGYDYNRVNKAGNLLNLDASNPNSYPRNGNKWFNDGIGGHRGLLVNTPTFNTANGGIFDFNGTNQYVTVASSDSSLRPTTSITLECWFKVSSTTGTQYLLDQQYGISTNSSYSLYVTNTSWVGGINILGTFETFSHPFTTTPLNTNTWYQFVYSYNGSTYSRSSTADVVTGSTILTNVEDLEDVFVGMQASGSGLVNDETTTTTVTDIDTVQNTVTISTAPTQTISGVNITFSDPPSHYMYINGDRVGISAVAGDIDYNAVNNFITVAGKFAGPGDNTGISSLLNGSIASARIYGNFQPQSTVRLNYNLLKSYYGL